MRRQAQWVVTLWASFLFLNFLQPCCMAAEKPLPCHAPKAAVAHVNHGVATPPMMQVICAKLQYVKASFPQFDTKAVPASGNDISAVALVDATPRGLPDAPTALPFRPPPPLFLRTLYLSTQRLRI